MKYLLIAFRLVFALYYFGVGAYGLAVGNRERDLAEATTSLERAMAELGFMDTLLCVVCIAGGAALFFSRTTPLGIVILAPLVTIIFLFHTFLTHSFAWGALNILWLAALAILYRRGVAPLWNYKPIAAASSGTE